MNTKHKSNRSRFMFYVHAWRDSRTLRERSLYAGLIENMTRASKYSGSELARRVLLRDLGEE